MKGKHAPGLMALLLSLMLMMPVVTMAAYPILRPGDSGAQVAQLQQALDALGYAVKADGKYGLMTQAAVQNFQRQKGIRQDGIAGPATLSLLYGGVSQPAPVPQPGATTAPQAARLELGVTGSEVQRLQQRLQELGYSSGRLDGVFDAGTQAAVRAFQRARGLKADGIAGPLTLSALYAQQPQPQPTAVPQPSFIPVPATAQPVDQRLELGATGDQVQNLQQKLFDLGYSSGRLDGVFDAGTQAAVRAFQRSQGLREDGIAGPQTLSRLYSLQPVPQPSQTPALTQQPTQAPQPPAASSATVFTGNGGVLRMRSEMDARKNNVITAIPDREALRVLSQQGSWSLVEWRNYQGYVMSSFLRFDAAPSPTASPAPTDLLPTEQPGVQPTATPNNPVPGVTGTATVFTRNGGPLNFRSTPENLGKQNLQGLIRNGQTVALLAYGPQWCRVQHEGRDGYVMTSFLTINAAPVPTALPGPAPTAEPTAAPTATPTASPTATPEPVISPTPLPTDASIFPRILRLGDTGEDVSLLQSRLNKLGYTVNENGMYDDSTFAAVKRFQAMHGLKADGAFGSQTASALMSSAARPADSAPLTYTTLRMGSEDKPGDEAVSKLQQRLKELGYSLTVDGAFGAGTHDALVSFQRSNGLSQTGVADASTQAKIYASDAKGPQAGGGVDLSGAKGGGPAEGSVRFLNWYTEVKPKIRGGQTAKVFHPASGVSFQVQYYSLGRHADAEPKTLRDTQVINAAFGKTSWDVRPVYVQLPDGSWTLATMHNYPHLYGSIANNGFGGHLCIHFRRELDETQRLDPNYGMQNQRILRQAWKSMTGEVVE